MHFKKLRKYWKLYRSSIITRTAGGTNTNTVLIKWKYRKKKVSHYFATYIHYWRDSINFALKSVGLNIVTYVFDYVIQVAPLGRETVNMIIYM